MGRWVTLTTAEPTDQSQSGEITRQYMPPNVMCYKGHTACDISWEVLPGESD